MCVCVFSQLCASETQSAPNRASSSASDVSLQTRVSKGIPLWESAVLPVSIAEKIAVR